MPRFFRPAALAALLLSALVASCGGDDHEFTVAVLADTNYVDYYMDEVEESEAPSEVPNMIKVLKDRGYRVVLFTGVSVDAFRRAVDDADVLLIPEQEYGSITDDMLEAGSDTVIARFVNEGGLLVTAYDFTWLNPVFGYSLSSEGGSTAPRQPNLANASFIGEWAYADSTDGTPFAGGPDSLPNLSATSSIANASLPEGTIRAYTDGDTGTWVAIIPQGAGHIVYLGWDWYDALPNGNVGAEWNALLDAVDAF